MGSRTLLGSMDGKGYAAVPRVTKAPTGWTAATPPASMVNGSSAPTVLVGKGGTAPLSIPGGRIPPDFGSVVPGRAVAATNAGHGAVKPNVTTANRAVFSAQQSAMNTAHHGTSGHVFAEPVAHTVFARPSAVGAPSSIGHSGAASAVGARTVSSPSASHGTSSAGTHK